MVVCGDPQRGVEYVLLAEGKTVLALFQTVAVLVPGAFLRPVWVALNGAG